MEKVNPTRSELLYRKQQIKLAVQGMELLKKKRDALLREFMPIIDEALQVSSQLERSMASGQASLADTRAAEGPSVLASLAYAVRREVLVDIHDASIMGVPIPEIRRTGGLVKNDLTRGYGITGTSPRVGETALRFEEILTLIIRSASVETRLRRLGEELKKTNRRVNALENNVIPELREQVRFVFSSLDERAREDHFRLKKVKNKIVLKAQARNA